MSNALAILNRQQRRQQPRRPSSLTISDPRGRVAAAAARRPVAPTRRTQQQKQQLRPSSAAAILERQQGGGGDEEQGLADKFFNTSVGSRLGALLNNGIVKSVIQPMDIVGVPGRAIASGFNETLDASRQLGDKIAGRESSNPGESASFQDFRDQINPFQWLHGENAEDSIGWGDILHKQTGGQGTGNQWADAALGFAGDVAFDPATYLAGVGVADKGLDAARAASRFANVADDVRKAAKVTPSRRSLTGRATRVARAATARGLFDDTTGAFHHLKGTKLGDDAIEAIEEVQRKGLSYQTSAMRNNPDLNELVRDALNVTTNAGPLMRAKIPFGPGVQKQLPDVGGVAQGLSNRMGNVRALRNASRAGEAIVGRTSPIDYENSILTMLSGKVHRGSRTVDASSDDLATAARVVRSIEAERPGAGGYLIPAQKVLRRAKGMIKNEIKDTDGSRARYMDMVETQGVETVFNKVMRIVGKEMPAKYGVSVPGDVGTYAPRVPLPKFLEALGGDAAWQRAMVARRGEQNIDLYQEGSALQKRQIQPDTEIVLEGWAPDGSDAVFNTGDAKISTLNQRVSDATGGAIPKAFEDDPIKLMEDYVESLSEDIGRRVGRADMIAAGTPGFRYNTERMTQGAIGGNEDVAGRQMAAESAQEQAAAQARRGESSMLSDEAVEAAGRTIVNLPDEELRRFVDQTFIGKDAAELLDRTIDANDWRNPTGSGNILLDPRVIQMRENIKRATIEAGLPGRIGRKITNFFKTYATLTPGFHVRNGLSAMYMNAADGVPFETTIEGIHEWGKMERFVKKGLKKEQIDRLTGQGNPDPADIDKALRLANEYIAAQPKSIQDMYAAVGGSGAGGRFTESGFAEGTGRLTSWITENPLTQWSQRVGSRVEGSVRMGMAMDSINKGGTIQEAVDRITRVHFDYSQVSRLDAGAKRLFPFWSFMSRNLPLQIMQQWSRPAMYSNYEHFTENFGDPEALDGLDGEVPDYIQKGGGMPFNLGPFNWFEPDLPHTRLHEDADALLNIGSNPAKALSGINPYLTAPLEYGLRKDTYTGRNYEGDDMKPVNWWNPVDLMAVIPGLLTNQDPQAPNFRVAPDGTWYVSERLYNSLAAVNPVMARADRASFGEERSAEFWWRLAGAPVRTITQDQIDSQQIGDYYDMLDRQEIERILAGG